MCMYVCIYIYTYVYIYTLYITIDHNISKSSIQFSGHERHLPEFAALQQPAGPLDSGARGVQRLAQGGGSAVPGAGTGEGEGPAKGWAGKRFVRLIWLVVSTMFYFP